MQQLTEIAMEKSAGGVFTRPEVACWLGGSDDRQFGMLRRAMRAGEIVRIHRGLYCLDDKYLRRKLDPRVLAQRIYGPSYISLETALSYHGWIPEAVYTTTSTSLGRSREFDTPLGRFSFTSVPQVTFYAEVIRVEKDGADNGSPGRAGESFLLATPLKALADYVYATRRDWSSAEPIIGSLRVEEDDLATIRPNDCERLAGNYTSRRVRRFLKGLGKDLKP